MTQSNKSKIKFYWTIASQPARSVKALLDIGHIPYQLIQVNIGQNQTRKPQFLKLNPLGQIPFIIDGQIHLGQSNAIMIYLVQKYQNNYPFYFYPKQNIAQRSLINQYLSWYQNYFRVALMLIIKLKIYGKLKKNEDFTLYQINLANLRMKQALTFLDSLLINQRYITGEYITLVDILVFFQLTNLIIYEQNWDAYKGIDSWFKRMYNVAQIKAILHDWFRGVRPFIDLLKSIKAVDEKNIQKPKL